MSRNSLNQHNVENLYVKRDKRSKSGFSCQYRDPRYGFKEFEGVKQFRSLGSDVSEAIYQAKRLNAIILPKLLDKRLQDIFDGSCKIIKSVKLREWLEKYREIQQQRLLDGHIKPNTYKNKKSIIDIITKAHGKYHLSSISTKHVTQLLNTYLSDGKNRMAQSIRSVYIDIFTEAAQNGEVKDSFNPAKVTKNPIVKVNKCRLSLEQFNKILNNQNYLPHKYTYLLALLTAQRRTDLSLIRKVKGDDWDLRFSKYKKNPSYFLSEQGSDTSFQKLVDFAPYSYIENEYLHIFQLKTGQLLRLPLSLKLKAFGMTIKHVIDQSNLFEKSEFVLHHIAKRASSNLGSPLHPETITRSFKKARDLSNINWNGSPATFHEIRSLSERLYRAEGIDTKILCGHRHQKTTDLYNDLRGTGWQTLDF